MKQADLKIGETYRLTSNYGKGEKVIVIDTGFDKPYSSSRPRKLAKGGTHVAVAIEKIYGGKLVWVPTYVAAFKIKGEIALADAEYAERNAAAVKANAEREARSKAAGERTGQNVERLAGLLGVDTHAIRTDYTRGYGVTGVVLSNSQVEALLAKLEVEV